MTSHIKRTERQIKLAALCIDAVSRRGIYGPGRSGHVGQVGVVPLQSWPVTLPVDESMV